MSDSAKGGAEAAPARPEPSAFFVGDVAFDEYYSAERWPGVADKAYVTAGKRYVGGMIANAARVYAGLGGRPDFISLLRDGLSSRELCQALEFGGVSTRHMLYDVDMADPRNFIVLVGGDHVVLTVDVGRPPMRLGEPAIAALLSPGYLYTTLNRARRLHAGPLEGAALFEAFRRCGRRAVFDLDVEGFTLADTAVLRGAAALIVNRAGFVRSFGEAEPRDVHRWMAEHEVELVVRTLAAEGAELYQGGRVLARPALRVPVVDVTGAGDAFGGALLFGLAHGFELGAALDLSIAAASRAVTIEGPQSGVVTLADLGQFAASHGLVTLGRNWRA